MAVFGSLKSMPFAELLQWLGGSRKTGLLRVERDKLAKRLKLSDGRVIACSSDDPREFLGHLLVSRGKLTEEHLREALGRHERSGAPLGTTLVKLGRLQQSELRRHLTEQAEEIIASIFEWEDGVFRFEDGPVSEEGFAIDLGVEDVLLRGMQRKHEVREIRTVFHDGGIVLERTGKLPPPEVLANRMARRIFESIDGQRTVAEILPHAHASEFLTTKFLFELYRHDLVRIKHVRPPAPEPAQPVVEPAPPATVGSTPSAAAVAARPQTTMRGRAKTSLQVDLEVAGNLLSRGEFESALEILDTAYRRHPGDEALGRLLAEAEEAFVEKAYRHFLPGAKIPVLLRPLQELTDRAFSPDEFFLLSRMTGTWDIKSIVQITPIREVEALRLLKRLREQGLIELRDPE